MTTTNTHAYVCDCGCGATIAVEFVGGFAGTTCRVEACARRRKVGAVDFTIPRSAALSMEPATVFTTTRHADGLVEFAGGTL